jgi:hypothetical protein
LFALLAVAIWLFWPRTPLVVESASDSNELVGYGDLEELTDIYKFRSAYLRANGGEDAWESVQSVRATGILEQGGRSFPFFSLKKRPDQSLTTIKLPAYDLTYVVDGDVVWQRIIRANSEPEYELKVGNEADNLVEMGEFFDPIVRALLFDQDGIENLSASEWDGVPVVKIEFKSGAGHVRSVAYVEIENMRPLAQLQKLENGSVKKVLYRDYRLVHGMQEPYLVETFVDDVLESRVILSKSDINVGAVASLFQLPQELLQN